MDRIEYSALSDEEKYHIALMQRIASAVIDTPLVLKGGTALLLAYNLDRFSEDLDFDSNKHLQLEGKIEKSVIYPLKLVALDKVKDTHTVTRYRVRYDSPASQNNVLKIEVSYREQNLSAAISKINGIRVYDVAELIRQKLSALENRTTARDLYDVSFLAKRYSEHFDEVSFRKLAVQFQDLNALEARFKLAFSDDLLLARTDLSELLISTQEQARSILAARSKQLKNEEIAEGETQDTNSTQPDLPILNRIARQYIEMTCKQTRLTQAMHEAMSGDAITYNARSQDALAHSKSFEKFIQESMENPVLMAYIQSTPQAYTHFLADRDKFTDMAERIGTTKMSRDDLQAALFHLYYRGCSLTRNELYTQHQGRRRH